MRFGWRHVALLGLGGLAAGHGLFPAGDGAAAAQAGLSEEEEAKVAELMQRFGQDKTQIRGRLSHDLLDTRCRDGAVWRR